MQDERVKAGSQADMERQLNVCNGARRRPARQHYQGQLGTTCELNFLEVDRVNCIIVYL